MQFPSGFIQARDCLITSKTFTEETNYGFNSEVAKRGNPHQWVIDFTTRLLTDTRARELSAFLDSLDGRYQTFTLPCPLPFLGSDKSFTVVSGANSGADEIPVDGLSANTTNALVAGDYVKFAFYDKVYKITKTVDSNANGEAVMTIYPRLHATIVANEIVSEAVFTLRMTKDTNGLNLSGSKSHVPIKFSAKEALNV